MFDRVPMLGQVGITEQAGFGGPAWGVNTPLNPNVRFPAPAGAPLYTEENVGRWMCPDGVERVLTVAQAQAMGCTRRNLMHMMGQGVITGPGPSGGGPVAGGPTVSVAPTVHNGGFTQPFNQFEQVLFYQPWYGYPRYPYYPPPPPPQQRMVCRKLEEQSEAEGRDVFECTYEPAPQAAYPAYTYPVQYTYPIQTYGYWF